MKQTPLPEQYIQAGVDCVFAALRNATTPAKIAAVMVKSFVFIEFLKSTGHSTTALSITDAIDAAMIQATNASDAFSKPIGANQ